MLKKKFCFGKLQVYQCQTKKILNIFHDDIFFVRNVQDFKIQAHLGLTCWVGSSPPNMRLQKLILIKDIKSRIPCSSNHRRLNRINSSKVKSTSAVIFITNSRNLHFTFQLLNLLFKVRRKKIKGKKIEPSLWLSKDVPILPNALRTKKGIIINGDVYFCLIFVKRRSKILQAWNFSFYFVWFTSKQWPASFSSKFVIYFLKYSFDLLLTINSSYRLLHFIK